MQRLLTSKNCLLKNLEETRNTPQAQCHMRKSVMMNQCRKYAVTCNNFTSKKSYLIIDNLHYHLTLSPLFHSHLTYEGNLLFYQNKILQTFLWNNSQCPSGLSIFLLMWAQKLSLHVAKRQCPNCGELQVACH